MKVIIKILEYLSERDAVVFRTCRLNSHKPIDEYPEKVVDCFDLNKNDTEDFIQSLVHKISAHLIEEQDENEGILDEKKCNGTFVSTQCIPLVLFQFGVVISSHFYL